MYLCVHRRRRLSPRHLRGRCCIMERRLSTGHVTLSRLRHESTTLWWCAACGRQYDWHESDRVLTTQAGCRAEAHGSSNHTLRLLEHATTRSLPWSPWRECRTKSTSWTSSVMTSRKAAGEMVAALRRFIEVDHHKALVLVSLLD